MGADPNRILGQRATIPYPPPRLQRPDPQMDTGWALLGGDQKYFHAGS